jgi:hypothetical protein
MLKDMNKGNSSLAPLIPLISYTVAGSKEEKRAARSGGLLLLAPMLLGVVIGLSSSMASAVPLYSKDVLCGTEKCGTMEITKYDPVNPTTVNDVGGVLIDGTFNKTKNNAFHYVQAVTTDDTDRLRWFNDISATLPSPYLDTPPGGYKAENPPIGSGNYGGGPDNNLDGIPDFDQPFDYLPWYDEGEFPIFYDRPASLVLRAKAQADGHVSVYFDTWLICLIDKELGPDNKLARDDKYEIAPLLGWTWGFDILYNDVANIGVDDLADFTVNQLGFNWEMTPPADWTGALSVKYGTGEDQDYWNIALGECKNCAVPEPATPLLLTVGLLALGGMRQRTCGKKPSTVKGS